MRTTLVPVVSVMVASSLCGLAVAGSIDSPGAPSSGSGMVTLQQMYNYLSSGIEVTPVTGFQEATSGPTAGTMKSTQQIYDDIKAKFAQCTATAAHVESGWTFFSTASGSWGVQMGSGLMQPTPTITPTLTPTQTSTPTQTQTQTPTPTPTWNQGACAAKGGYWAADNLGGYGCWFDGGLDFCDHFCASAPRSLVCDPSNWDDNSTCSVCKHYYPGSDCEQEVYDHSPNYITNQYKCQTRGAAWTQNCALASGAGNQIRFCICKP
ncbi:MAG: hypothetical protein NTZ78_09805 [Candidatus Aureabacteria bacterium]|nr:hypothetical protein [Candidatus Auribacterota bacterium]